MRMNSLFRLSHLDRTEPLYRYRIHPASLTAREKQLRINERVASFMPVEAARRAWFLQPFDVIVVGEHGWFDQLARGLQEGGNNVTLLRGSSKLNQPYSFTVTRAHPKAIAAFSAVHPPDRLIEHLELVRANPAHPCVALLFVDDEREVSETLLQRFDAVIACDGPAWNSLRNSAHPRRFRIVNPDAALYCLLALGNAVTWRSKKKKEPPEIHRL
jgi:hypothetical protein